MNIYEPIQMFTDICIMYDNNDSKMSAKEALNDAKKEKRNI